MSIRVFELDKVCHMPFGALLRAAAAPIDARGSELGLPFSEFLRAADVESEVVQRRRGRRTYRDAMLIPIRPHIRDFAVRRRARRKSEHLTREMLESVTIWHADADLHNILNCRHDKFSFRERNTPINDSISSVQTVQPI